MTVQPLAFSTANLFTTLRASHLSPDRGIAVIQDPATLIYLAVADASFYDLEAFIATSGMTAGTFSGQAVTRTTSTHPDPLRAIINGQVIDKVGGTRFIPVWGWKGEVIHHGVNQPPIGGTRSHRHIGKWPGRTEKAYQVKRGNPSSQSVQPPYVEATGALLPIIEGGRPFTATSATGANVGVTANYSPAIATKWLGKASLVGKVICGVHRSQNLLFFLVQEDGSWTGNQGADLATVIGHIASWGVDDAAMGDGSDSATLVVDGQVISEPGAPKDQLNNNGLAWRERQLTVNGGPTVITSADATLAAAVGALPANLTGAQAVLSWKAGGIEMELTALAANLTAAQLRVPSLPLTLTTTGNNLVAGLTFADAAGTISIELHLSVTGPANPGTLVGDVTLTGGGAAVGAGTIAWTLAL